MDLGRSDYAEAMARQQQREGDGGKGKAAARWNWNRRTSAEGLPHGIVQTSSDMFLRPLWDPAAKRAIPKVRSPLIIPALISHGDAKFELLLV